MKFILWIFSLVFLMIALYFQFDKGVYFAIGLSGFILSLTLIFLPNKVRINLIIVLISVILALYLLEFFISFFINESYSIKEQRVDAAKKIGIEYDIRSKYDLLKEGKGLVTVTVSPSNFINHNDEIRPLSPSKSKSYVINCNESGKYATYKSDRFGFNNIDSIWDFDKVNWVVTGDSFVNGSCVPEESTITRRLNLESGNSVLNVASNGNGPLLSYAALKEYAYPKRPDKVVWIYYEGNDIVNLNNEIKDKILVKYFKKEFSQKLNENQSVVDDAIEKYISSEFESKNAERQNYKNILLWNTWYLRLYHLRDLIKKTFFQYASNKKIIINPNLFKIISLVKEEISKWKGELIFVYFPEYSRYSNMSINHDNFKERMKLLNGIKSLNIEVIDIHNDIFSQEKNPKSLFPFELFGHYTEEAYNKISKIIVQKILKI
jgi:hypothetical protein